MHFFFAPSGMAVIKILFATVALEIPVCKKCKNNNSSAVASSVRLTLSYKFMDGNSSYFISGIATVVHRYVCADRRCQRGAITGSSSANDLF